MKVFFILSLAAALTACSREPEQATPNARNKEDARPAQSSSPSAAPQDDTRKKLVVFGDSLSAGYGLGPGESYPDDLQRKLDAAGYAWQVVNLGISGDTTEGGIARLDASVALKPALAIVELGGNDGLRGLPLEVTRKNLEALITAFEGAGAKV